VKVGDLIKFLTGGKIGLSDREAYKLAQEFALDQNNELNDDFEE